MDIGYYLEPYSAGRNLIRGISPQESLGAKVSFYTGNNAWFNVAYEIVVIGVPETRNAVDNKESDGSPLTIRKWLYAHGQHKNMPVIGDAGNVKGNGLNDRWGALGEVVSFFDSRGTIIIVIGGSQDLSLPVFKALTIKNSMVRVVTADAMLDIDARDNDFSNRSWVSYLVTEYPDRVKDLTVVGNQGFYNSAAQEEFLAGRFLDNIKLGQARGNDIKNVEIPVRDADFFSFDFRVIAGQPQLNDDEVSQIGFNPFEACQIARYAGLSDRLRVIGLFETPPGKPGSADPALLAAQVLWHFIDGVTARYGDYPVRPIEAYKYLVVALDDQKEGLEFYHNQLNGRWWMKVPRESAKEHDIISCGREDYLAALRKEYPDKWWRCLRRNELVQKEIIKRGDE